MMSMIGAQGTNAFTSNDMTVYQEDIPSNELERWLMIEGERFANPVFRLFHTELEAVYEEKNMNMANDSRTAYADSIISNVGSAAGGGQPGHRVDVAVHSKAVRYESGNRMSRSVVLYAVAVGLGRNLILRVAAGDGQRRSGFLRIS